MYNFMAGSRQVYFSLEALERQYFIKKGSVFNSKTIHVSGKEIKHNMASLKLKEIILQGQVECVDHLYLTLNIEGIRTPYFVDLTELVFSDLKEVSVGQSIYILGRLAESVENKSYLIAKELNLNKS